MVKRTLKQWQEAKKEWGRQQALKKLKKTATPEEQAEQNCQRAQARKDKHLNHKVVVNLRPDTPHYAELRCADCDKYIQWINKQDYNLIKEMENA